MSTPSSTPTPAAGWFADPHAPGQLRWWDGSRWTEHVHRPIEPRAAAADYVDWAGMSGPARGPAPIRTAPPSSSLMADDPKSIVALACTGAYILVVLTIGLVVPGLRPGAVSSFDRSEKLAAVALAAAVIAVCFACMRLSA